MDIFAIAGLVLIILLPIALIMWSQQKKQIGTIRCKRCNHVGPPKGQFVLFRGIKPVCQKCQSEDWVAAKKT